MPDLMPFEDPENEGNGSKYHTGEKCVETGCDNPAGTWWSPFWCFECNVKRIRRIDKQLGKMVDASHLDTGDNRTNAGS